MEDVVGTMSGEGSSGRPAKRSRGACELEGAQPEGNPIDTDEDEIAGYCEDGLGLKVS